MFAIRIDIDTRKGLIHGVPQLLDLCERYDITASFYVPMGGEATLLDVVRYRGGPSFDQEHIEKLTFREKLRTVVQPRNFAKEHATILEEIAQSRHELGVHGYKHRHWTRGLDELDIGTEIERMQTTYKDIIGTKPDTFAAPGFRTNEDVLRELDAHGIVAGSDLDGRKPFHPSIDGEVCDHVQVPITLKQNRMPPIEAWRLEGREDEQIIDRLIEAAQQDFAATYLHPAYEALQERDLLEQWFNRLNEHGIETATIRTIAHDHQ